MKKLYLKKSTELSNSELKFNLCHLSLTSLPWKNVRSHHAQEVYKLRTILIVPHKREHFWRSLLLKYMDKQILLNLLKQGETQTPQNYSELDNGKSISAVGFTCPEWSLKSFLQKLVSELCVLYQNSILHSSHHWSAELGPQTAGQQGMLESLPELTGQIYPTKQKKTREGWKRGSSCLKMKTNHRTHSPLKFTILHNISQTDKTEGLPNYLFFRNTFEISVCF